MPKQVKDRRLTPSGGRLILATVAAGCFAVLMVVPRPVMPAAPVLRLERGAILDMHARDERLSRLDLGPEGEALRTLYAEQGRAEAGVGESEGTFGARRDALRAALEALEAANEDGLAALRAWAAVGVRSALQGTREDEDAFLGTFPRMLERYGGERRPPDFVVRTLFVARLNGILGRELSDGFTPVERQAYWGWLAFGASNVPTARRQEALAEFVEAGGDGMEARAWLALQGGEPLLAARLYGQAAEAKGSIRLRNHSLACRELAVIQGH